MAQLDTLQRVAYMDRIDLGSDVRNHKRPIPEDMHLLQQLIACHQRTVPFENLSLVHPKAKQQDGGRIHTALEDVFDKLVTRHRGGYCFEQNALFAAFLQSYGFELFTTAARVVQFGKEPSHPDEVLLNGFDHQLTLVHLEDQWWAVDVGFGSQVPRQPVPLQPAHSDAAPASPTGAQHRVRRGTVGSRQPPSLTRRPQSEGWYMQKWSEGQHQWEDLYFFTEVEFTLNDYKMANWFTSTHPDCLFMRDTVAAIFTGKGRVTLKNDMLKVYERRSPEAPLEVTEERQLASNEQLDAALMHYFGIAL